MSATDVTICNLALSHLGESNGISALTDPRNGAARACNQWYEQCRDELLREFAWPFATTTVMLALVAADPTPEWGYSYTYPSDALKLVRAPFGSTRNPTEATLTRYKIARGASGGRVLYMDQTTATIEYIVRVTDANEFPPDFVVALSYLIASRICSQITKENKANTALLMWQGYQSALKIAMANAANESAPDPEPESALITARL